MQPPASRHATDEILEQYAMGGLAERELEEFENHLLVCANCQEALRFTDSYLEGMRGASRELRRQAASRARPWYDKFPVLPAPAWVLATATFAFLVIAGDQWRSFRPDTEPLSLVRLESTRGAETAVNSTTLAQKPFLLMLDLTDLQPLPRYKLEIVDAVGHPVFESNPSPANNTLRTKIAEGLPAGVYYVRLYDPHSELLREYGLKVRE